MKIAKLFIQMLRYRVAVMLLLFFFLAVAIHGKLSGFSFLYLYAAIILSSTYVAATTINDIADKDIDRVNHQKSKGRPLVSREANEKELSVVHAIAVLIALLTALFLGIQATIITLVSLGINYIYSVSPFRFSYRTYFAPILLACAYVGVPYFLGLTLFNESFQQKDMLFLLALLFLFIGRIILKDFRDREGDKKYGKPTFLLRFGKNVTCIVSFVAIVIGNFLLLFLLFSQTPLLPYMTELFFLTIYIAEYQLFRTNNLRKEQQAIGIGAKMGNGLLILLLTYFILHSANAPIVILNLLLLAITSLYLFNFYLLVKQPNYAVIGYKG